MHGDSHSKFCVINKPRQYENLRLSQECEQTFKTKIMHPVPKNLLKEYIQSQHFTSTMDQGDYEGNVPGRHPECHGSGW